VINNIRYVQILVLGSCEKISSHYLVVFDHGRYKVYGVGTTIKSVTMVGRHIKL